MDTKQFALSYDYITKPREVFLKELSKGIYRSLVGVNADPIEYRYSLVLQNLGFVNVIECEPEKCCEVYISYMIDNDIPLYQVEAEIALKLGIISDISGIQVIKDSTYFANVNQDEQVYLSTVAASGYILYNFKNYVRGMGYVIKTDEEYKELLKEYINANYTIIQEDTTIIYTIPRRAAKEKIRVYIPKSIDCSKQSPLDYLTDLTYDNACDQYVNCMPGHLRKDIIEINKTLGNILYFSEDEATACTVMELDFLARKYRCHSIQTLLSTTVNVGIPIQMKLNDEAIFFVGNYDETISMISSHPTVKITKDRYQTLLKLVKGNKLCTITKNKQKYAGVAIDGVKKMIWDAFYINSTPVDGNYNNLVKQNVQ